MLIYGFHRYLLYNYKGTPDLDQDLGSLLGMMLYHKKEPFLLIADAEYGEDGTKDCPDYSFWSCLNTPSDVWLQKYVRSTYAVMNPNSDNKVMAWLLDNSAEARQDLVADVSGLTLQYAYAVQERLSGVSHGTEDAVCTDQNESTLNIFEFPYCCGIGFIESTDEIGGLVAAAQYVETNTSLVMYDDVDDVDKCDGRDVALAFVLAVVDAADLMYVKGSAKWVSEPLNGKVLLSFTSESCDANNLWD